MDNRLLAATLVIVVLGVYLCSSTSREEDSADDGLIAEVKALRNELMALKDWKNSLENANANITFKANLTFSGETTIDRCVQLRSKAVDPNCGKPLVTISDGITTCGAPIDICDSSLHFRCAKENCAVPAIKLGIGVDQQGVTHTFYSSKGHKQLIWSSVEGKFVGSPFHLQ